LPLQLLLAAIAAALPLGAQYTLDSASIPSGDETPTRRGLLGTLAG
jgi:hypothetical protein